MIVGVSSTWTFHKASITPTVSWSEGAPLKLYASVFQGDEMKKIQDWHYQGSERTRFIVWFLGGRQMRLPSIATFILTKLVECTLWFLTNKKKQGLYQKRQKKKHTLYFPYWNGIHYATLPLIIYAITTNWRKSKPNVFFRFTVTTYAFISLISSSFFCIFIFFVTLFCW